MYWIINEQTGEADVAKTKADVTEKTGITPAILVNQFSRKKVKQIIRNDYRVVRFEQYVLCKSTKVVK